VLTRLPRHTRRAPRRRSARGHRLALTLAVAAIGFGSAVAAPALVATVLHGDDTRPIGSAPSDKPALGMVYTGLNPARKGTPCVGAYEVVDPGQCSHGPDLPPPGLNVKTDVLPATGATGAPAVPGRDLTAGPTEQDLATDESGFATESGLAVLPDGGSAAITIGSSGVACEGDGVSGRRVQVLYVRDAGVASRFAQYAESFRTWAAGVDAIYDASAQETGGSRHIRYVTTPDCRVDVQEVEVPAGSMNTFRSMIAALKGLGFGRTDRKYMVFGDARVYCGIGTFTGDERTGAGNRSNRGPSYGRSDSGCWTPAVAAHELGHNLGAVNNSAPNSSGGGHCVDEHDVMCYRDTRAASTRAASTRVACSDRAREQRLDCNHDDYYNTSPRPGSYLATHWNMADNAFLINGGNGGGAPKPTPSGGVAPAPVVPAPASPAPVVPAPGSPAPGAGPGTPTPSASASQSGAPGAPPPSTGPPGTTPSASATATPGAPTTPGASGTSAAPERTGAGPGASSAPPPGADALKDLRISERTSSSVRLSWDAAAEGARYGIVVNGKVIGKVNATGVRIVGMRAGTEYRISVAVIRADSAATPYTATVTVRTAVAEVPAAGVYLVLANAMSSRVADLYGARSGEGTPLVLDRARGATNQQWKLEPTAAGGFLIRSRVSGRCIAPKDGPEATGTPLVQVTCDQSDTAQHWKVEATEYGISVTSERGLVIGVGNTRFSGARLLVLQRPTGNRYQSWSVRGA